MPVFSPEVTAGLAAEVLSLPSDVNPYTWLKTAIQTRVIPQLTSTTYQVLLFIAVGLHAIALLCHLATLYFRARGKVLWFLKRNTDGYLT